ncbi:MLO-like protein 9 [Gossypium australe]|uniref:MLO-like protein n=1 Tax=Gossypium australe TaxID=47621 RepID=A0A5B6W5W3_9ROSI|nr:MLO-like protein 9 [Gossypium australe]
MAGGASPGARELDQTPTWAVALVVAVIIMISIALEKVLHSVGELFEHKKKEALYEALQKVKGELMVLGFISLLLTFGQSYISKICIPERLADTMLFCPKKHHHSHHGHQESGGGHHRRLFSYDDDDDDDVRRFLGGDGGGPACKLGHVPLISVHGLHQLHIFIFFLAVFHVAYGATTMMLGRLKTRAWKDWERECVDSVTELNNPSRFRLTHETSFVRDHTRGAWTKTKFSFYFVHLTPGSKFDFQKYIKKSLEDDFKVVVGITPALWASAVIFLLMDVHGWHVMSFISMIPLVVTLAVGTKLQAIIARMALEIVEKHAVIQGMPLVQVSDQHFWFGWPPLVLHLIHFVLFQNAFEITYFFWIWYEFGLRSCFHQDFTLITIRVCLGVVVQFICSYITLPLYALVTQMGSTMKRSIFDEQTSKALKQWHKKAAQKKAEAPPRSKMPGGDSSDNTGRHDGDSDHQDVTVEAQPNRTQNNNNNNNNVDLLTGP